MKVLLINTFDRGGAGNAAVRLHRGLKACNIDSKMLFRFKNNTTIPNAYEYVNPIIKRTLLQRIIRKFIRDFKKLFSFSINENKENKQHQRFLNSRNKQLEMFSFPDSEIDITTDSHYIESEIIHIHWVAEFLNFSVFFQKNNKPIIWTLHDMHPFSEGEHYQEIYCGIDAKGLPIKRVISDYEISFFKEIMLKKKEALNGVNNIHIVVLCTWMQEEVRKSELFHRFPVTIIPNGIDISIFKPRNKKFSQDLLGIPADKTVLLFVADAVESYRKGYEYLLLALDTIKRNDIVLCTVGQKTNDLKISDNLIEIGVVQDEKLMSVIYSAADVFIIPSVMDNLPNTVVESLLCGTPVIGFPVGGMTDLIQDGENGYLTDDISVSSLATTIDKFLNNKDCFDNSKIVKNARDKYDLNIMSKKYIELYTKILNEQT